MNHGIRRTLSLSAIALMTAVTLAACGSDSDEAEPTVTRVAVEGAPPTRTATVPPEETPEAEGPAGTPPVGGDGGDLATTVELVMVDIAFEPTELTIPANTDVTINLPNQGALPHAFQLADGSVSSEEIPGGQTGSVVVNLPPGEYDFICPVPGHADAGMVGTLTVVEGGAVAEAPADEAGGEAAAESAPTTVDLDMVDIAFEPTELTIAANTDVTINLTNSGALPHAFELTDQGIASEEIAGGGSGSIVVNLPPGEYDFICPVPGHADAGMVGTLIVTEGGPGDEGTAEDAVPAEESPAASPEASPAASPVAELPTEFELVMIDIAFEPVDFTIAANTDVTINLTNSGALPHAFQLEDGSVASEEIPGGESGSVTLNLPPGEYRYICPVPGHVDAGMVGTITVE